MMDKLHLRTPGSGRRFCEECHYPLWPALHEPEGAVEDWTDDPVLWLDARNRCTEPKPEDAAAWRAAYQAEADRYDAQFPEF